MEDATNIKSSTREVKDDMGSKIIIKKEIKVVTTNVVATIKAMVIRTIEVAPNTMAMIEATTVDMASKTMVGDSKTEDSNIILAGAAEDIIPLTIAAINMLVKSTYQYGIPISIFTTN